MTGLDTLELWGFAKRPGEDPRCPRCGRWCATVYVRGGRVLGCEKCVLTLDAWEMGERMKDAELCL